MKLYEVPRNSRIRVLSETVESPPCSLSAEKNEVLDFAHVDGMYSLCYRGDGEIVHLSALTDVEIVD